MRERRALRGGLLALVLALAPLGVGELLATFVPPSDPALIRYLFRQEFNLDRWEFLRQDQEVLAIDDSAQLLSEPFEERLEGPEAGRPPFDRVDRNFSITTNQLGYRDRILKVRRPGVRRVVAVGDSVTWAKGVDQDRRYTELLDATLGDGVEVWNFGVEGSTAVKVGRTLPTLAAWEPDLVVWQASANDSDLTAWRLAEEKPMPRTGIVANQILARSQLLLRLSYWLAGDPFARFAPQLRAATAQRYGDAVERVFDSAAEAGWPVVVLTLAYATGEPYGQHVAHGCRARPDVCLGVVQVDFEGAAGWLGEDPAAWATPSEVWRAKAALSRRVDDRTLPLVFPWSGFFHDIVHPNDRGHRLMAAQLARFLEQGWLAPAGPAPGSPAPSRTSLPPTPAGAP